MKSLKDYIYDSLLQHVALELKNNDPIYEKYGLYDGCSELAKYIVKRCKNINSFDEDITIYFDEVKDIENIKFDKMIIKFDNGNNKASYVPHSKQMINNKTNRLELVQLLLYIEFNQLDKIILPAESTICHELTHIYNDYVIQVAGYSSFYEIFSSLEYQRSKTFSNSNYPSQFKKFLRAIYMLNDYERNGFMASLSKEIEPIKDKHLKNNEVLKVEDIMQEIRGLQIYKDYMQVIEYIEIYSNNKLYRKEKEELVDEWEKYFKERINVDEIFDRLKRNIVRLKRKMESLIPKKIAEKLDWKFNCVIID